MLPVLDREGVETAVYDDHCAAHGLRGVRGKVLQRADQLVGLEEAAVGRVAQDGVRTGRQRAVGVRQERAVLVRQQEARGDGVDAQPVAELHGQLAAEVLRPVYHGGLCHAVAGHACQRTQRRFGSEVDDRAVLLLDHCPGEDHRRQDRAEEVQLRAELHRLDVQIEDRLVGLHGGAAHVAARGVEQDVDRAVAGHDLAVVLLQGGLVEHVRREEAGFAAGGLDLGDETAGDLGCAFEIQQHHLGALFGEMFDDGRAQDAAGTGHDDHLTLYTE